MAHQPEQVTQPTLKSRRREVQFASVVRGTAESQVKGGEAGLLMLEGTLYRTQHARPRAAALPGTEGLPEP